MEATATFVQLLNNFFDCLNVGNFTDGKCARNPFKQPYHGPNDFRLRVWYFVDALPVSYQFTDTLLFPLQWLETEFLGYLEQWEKAVTGREGFTECEKKTMLLSAETVTGLKLTGITILLILCVCQQLAKLAS